MALIASARRTTNQANKYPVHTFCSSGTDQLDRKFPFPSVPLPLWKNPIIIQRRSCHSESILFSNTIRFVKMEWEVWGLANCLMAIGFRPFRPKMVLSSRVWSADLSYPDRVFRLVFFFPFGILGFRFYPLNLLGFDLQRFRHWMGWGEMWGFSVFRLHHTLCKIVSLLRSFYM